MRKLIALGIALLLSGCLEAYDLVEEKLGSPRYCHTPTSSALCEPGS